MRTTKQIAKLWKRPSKDGTSFTFYLRFTDLEGKQRCPSLGHCDKRKAEKQRAKKEKELRMRFCQAGSIRLKDFLVDSLKRTGDQIRCSTREEYESAMNDFINVMGNKDFSQITLKDGEYYRQVCLDSGNSPATVAKKITEIKVFFKLALERGQIDDNPLQNLKKPKATKNKIRFYRNSECERMMKAASELVENSNPLTRPQWDLIILFALSTGLRRGEILNCIWDDIDFGEQEVNIEPKENTETTWQWEIKDKDRRSLPLTDELIQLLISHQNRQPEGYPYVFVPPARYDYIQSELRAKGLWKFSDSRLKVVNNFKKDFDKILKKAKVKHGTFHDLRRTAICNWFIHGMSELDVMKLAGHADFDTTHKYYLAATDDLVDRARIAIDSGLCKKLVHLCARPYSQTKEIDKVNKKSLYCKDLKDERP
ncbi:MAG: tyrosine-type recombinase/integrase [Planctomycetota bacterium]|jgi:integrase